MESSIKDMNAVIQVGRVQLQHVHCITSARIRSEVKEKCLIGVGRQQATSSS